jgi:tape measure domain-containing protein|tara:strand:+ start:19 stop:1794 length:1776 start_codon:yes stop_codon:yes gene_type:complete
MQKSVFQMLLDVKTRGSNNIRRLGRDLQGVQGKAKNLASSFTGLTKPLIALAGISGGAALVTSIFGSRAELESQTRSLQVLTGSAEKTKQIVGEIKAFGAATPFQVRDLINVTKKLKAFGIETDSLVDTTKRLGDIAGATGADLDGIATAFGQIRAKGKFSQEENLQLLERGVDLTTELKKMYGLSGDELAKAMSKGQISFEAANQALITLTNQGGQYFGGAVAQADTLNGKLSTLQDAFVTLGQNIGKVLEPLFKGILDFVTFLTNKLNSLFEEADIRNEALKNVQGGLSRAQFFRSKDAKARLEAEIERIKGERATASGGETVQFTPALLASTATTEATKETVQASNEMLQILEQINVARVAGNEFQLAGLEFDREMLRIQEEGLTGNNLAIAQSSALADFDLKRQQLLSGTTEKQKELNKETDKYKITLDQIKDTLANQMTSAIEGLIDGTKTLGQSLSGLLRTFGSMFLRAGMGSFFSNIFPSAKGNVFAQNGIVPYAKGGYIGRPTMALMGEAGPEAVLPLRRGRGGRLGVETSGGSVGNVTVNVDASGSAVEGDTSQAAQLGKMLGAAVQAELVKQKRPGGLLAS